MGRCAFLNDFFIICIWKLQHDAPDIATLLTKHKADEDEDKQSSKDVFTFNKVSWLMDYPAWQFAWMKFRLLYRNPIQSDNWQTDRGGCLEAHYVHQMSMVTLSVVLDYYYTIWHHRGYTICIILFCKYEVWGHKNLDHLFTIIGNLLFPLHRAWYKLKTDLMSTRINKWHLFLIISSMF